MAVTSRAFGGALLFLLGSAVACGTRRPPGLEGDDGISKGPTGEPGLDVGATTTGACDAGSSSSGVCGCLDLTLLDDVPNLYFVLDRSGSMAKDDKWNQVRAVVSSLSVRLGPRAKCGAALFPGSDDSDCAPGTEVLAPRQGDAPAGTRGPAASSLLTATAVDAFGGTPTAATLRALTPRLAALTGRTFVILATDGGPNCNADARCGVDRCLVNIESMSESCTPAGPLNCCASDLYGPRNCLDDDATVAAVADLAKAGIPTFVIGVPGSTPYATALDRMAVAGGTALATSPRYYRVDAPGEDAMNTALAAVAARATGSCTLPLQAPADPSMVNVYLDGAVVRQAGDDGWRLDGSQVVLLGATCQRVLSGDALNVRVVAGCSTVVN